MGPGSDASDNKSTGLSIEVNGDGTNAELNVKGENTFNSNGFAGMYTTLSGVTDSTLEINVESGATLETCENDGSYDIGGFVPAGATTKFLGDGYTCDPNRVEFIVFSGGTVVEPDCQGCPP